MAEQVEENKLLRPLEARGQKPLLASNFAGIQFLFIKLLGMPVTIDSYIEMLKKVLKDNSMVKLITNFWSATMNQKMYIMMSVGLYFYNLENHYFLIFSPLPTSHYRLFYPFPYFHFE